MGPSPADEQCVEVGDPDYARDARAECRLFIEAIKKICGAPPEGARLVIRSQPHEFGAYLECCVVFDGDNQAAAEYAAKCDEHAPTTWEAAGMEPPARGRGR